MAVSLITAADCRAAGGDALAAVATPERAAYLRGFLSLGPAALASTRDLDRFVLVVNGKPVPVVINDGHEQDCYLLSPYAHYVKYLLLELRKIAGTQARLLARGVDLLGRISLPLGFNRCISVNNWLMTTNPDLQLTPTELDEVTRALVARRPAYPIVVRCVDARVPAARTMFEDAGYKLVVNRPVHEWEAHRLSRYHRREVTADIRLLDDPRFEVTRAGVLAAGEEEDVFRLYTALYVKKHVGFNCRYTARFFRLVHDAGLMAFTLIRNQERIVAFSTLFEDGARTVAALVGYDTALDRRRFPLYRMLIADALRAGKAQQRRIFLSTGAAQFKLNRGSYEWIEYEAVYDRHLPPHRRLPWAAFKAVLDAGTKNLNTSEI